ncbi:MAG: type VI secretion system baseplate subunit TssK [Deltaproteobacteria bacterium]|nr:type VI secretion system baseplate subunit TssK [Deltaproteobacteria bacterium]
MTTANGIPEAIQWHEGMLLAPQHFQQLALRYEELLHYHMMMVAPFHWGVRHFKLDEALLISGTLRILELEAVMPDGLVVSHGFHEDDGLEVNLTGYPEEMKQGEMTIHLVVPAKKPSPVKGDLPRYHPVEGNPVADENTEEGKEVRIPRLRPRISLLVTNETPPQKYVSFPLVKVRYEDEKFTRTEFIASSLRVPAEIDEACSKIAMRLREQARLLSEKSRVPFLTKENFIRNLVATLPYFEAVLKTKESHPYMLYLALCSLVGHLAAFGPSLLPPELPPYNHNDLFSTFERVTKFVNEMIDKVPMRFSTFRFDFENGVFSLLFKDTWMKKGLIIGVKGEQGMSEEEVIDWVERCLIGCKTKIQSMREKRILGVGRQRTEGDKDLVPSRGEVFFSLEDDSEFIESNEVLQILNPDDLSGECRMEEITLYVPSELFIL